MTVQTFTRTCTRARLQVLQVGTAVISVVYCGPGPFDKNPHSPWFAPGGSDFIEPSNHGEISRLRKMINQALETKYIYF